jgi:hypothetical protein
MTKGAIAAAINHHSIRDTIARLARVDADELSILNSPLDSIATGSLHRDRRICWQRGEGGGGNLDVDDRGRSRAPRGA